MLQHLTLRLKLEILVSALIGVISLFILLYFPVKFERQTMEALVEHAHSIGMVTAFNTSSALYFSDKESAEESLGSLKTIDEISYTVITDNNGNEFVSYIAETSASSDIYTFAPEEIAGIKQNGKIYQITEPVLKDNQTIGYVILGFSLEKIKTSVSESRKAIALFSFIIFLFGITTIVIISEVITKPLMNMVHTVRQIEEGNIGTRANENTSVELKELAVSFNTMLDSLQASYTELETLNKTLEDRVRQRTAQLNNEIDVRKKAEADLQIAKEYTDRLFDLAPIAIYSVGTDGKITSWNRKASEIMGLSADDAIGKDIGSIFPAPEAVDSNHSDNIPDNPSVLTITNKNGHQIILSKYSDVLRDENGNSMGTIECFEDITYRNRLEEELQLRQRMDSLGNIAGGIAHDFNNLLMGIIGNLDLLLIESCNMSDEQRNYIDESLSISHRAAKLIKEIQSITHGTLTRKTNFDLYDVAGTIFAILERTTDKLIDKRIDFMPGKIFIYANEDQIHQVLLNLGTNSVSAFDGCDKNIAHYIRLEAEEYYSNGKEFNSLPEGTYIHILFSDNGCGMTENIRNHAFDPLFTTRQKGTQKGQGLGLAMVYSIITKNHKGHVEIESSPGKGTTIHLYLAKGQKPQVPDPVPVITPGKGEGTILVIEDEDSIREITKTMLRNYGYTVITAFDGIDGLEKFHMNIDKIDLIILDLSMPRMSGKMLFEHIRLKRPDSRIIISSGHNEDVMNTYQDADSYLSKPYKLDTLISTVAGILHT